MVRVGTVTVTVWFWWMVVLVWVGHRVGEVMSWFSCLLCLFVGVIYLFTVHPRAELYFLLFIGL